MATLKVNFENGKFVGHNGVYVKNWSERSFFANGWKSSIEENGTIVFECARNYSNGLNCIRCVVFPNGYHKVTIKEGDYDRVRTLRQGFLTKKGQKLEGTFGLAGGEVSARYVYFRQDEFSSFLEKHGITAVSNEDPNHKYTIHNAWYGGGRCDMTIYTDGTQESIDFDCGRSEKWAEQCPGTSASEGEETVLVTGATWVIVDKVQNGGDCHNSSTILYTKKNPMSLDLPIIE